MQFSVVIPVYNHARFVSEAVTSALRSSLVKEVLTCDDGSQDNSRAVVRHLAAKYPGRIRDLTPADNGNRGAHYRLNELVEAASCEWIAVLNSDDMFISNRFETVVSHEVFRQSDFVFGNILLMNERTVLTGAKRGPFDVTAPFPSFFDVEAMVAAGHFIDLLAHQNFLVTTSNMLFRKTLHGRVGGFRQYRYVHDWDFALRSMVLGRPLYMPRYLTAYRQHDSNTVNESATQVFRESKDMLEAFVREFPEIASRPLVASALAHNPNLAALR